MTRYTRPAALTDAFDVTEFESGTPLLDAWLVRRSLRNQATGASRTFVTCPVEGRGKVVGFYSLSASAVALDEAPGRVRRNMPDPIPVILLGRLAVDHRHQGAGLGSSLLQDAVRRVVGVADTIGVRALLVHAMDDAAAAFYERFGFIRSPVDDQTLMLPIDTIRKSIQSAGD